MYQTAKTDNSALILQKLIFIVEGSCCLLLMRILLLRFSFKKIILRYKLEYGSSKIVLSVGEMAQANALCWAVRIAAKFTPGRSTCLAQSLAAMVMLRRRRIAGTLYLGVARNTAKDGWPIIAHAWLVAGGATLIGAVSEQQYTTIAKFYW